MKQILQHIRSGKLEVGEVCEPALAGPGVLVVTQASVISAGTERMITEFAEKSFIGKARSRPEDVKQVINKIKRDGFKATFQSVWARLDQPMALGYSAAGIVLAVSPEVTNLKAGDRVACGGAGHAEIIFVPKNLAVPMPENLDFESASFATLGSIAMQGVRVAGLVIGQKVAVIGLGLLGLITIQLVKAAGCRVIGADIDPEKITLAQKLGCDRACLVSSLADVIGEYTVNEGADAVIITAASHSNEPMELAAQIAGKKAIISSIGAVKMDVPRGPFYQKELQLRISTSYGPGRYDAQYEQKGIDYPRAYVPWTEQRNMACVLDMMAQGKLDVKPLITHRIPIEDAARAYNIIGGKIKERYLGIVLEYPKFEQKQFMPLVKPSAVKPSPLDKKAGIGVIGAGNFAKLVMLPAMKHIDNYKLIGLADVDGLVATYCQKKFDFSYATGDYKKLLDDDKIDIIFVTTRHDMHAMLVKDALSAGKHVMVEKPLCLTEQQLREIIELVEQHPDRILMVGFNRRFAPMAVEVKKVFKDKGPLVIDYMCNAGFVPKQGWTHDIEIGGGRVISEGCHFIDWMIWLTDSMPIKVYSQSISRETSKSLKEDNVMTSIQFENGSIGNMSYIGCGDQSYTKEYIQIYGGGSIAVIEDFKRGFYIENGKRIRLPGTSKGHLEQWCEVAEAVKYGRPSPIPFEQIACTTWCTFKALDSLRIGQAIEIGIQQ